MKIIFAALLLFNGIAHAQNTTIADSLIADVAAQKTDTNKIKTLSELAFFYATNNPALSLKYAKEEKLLADKTTIPKFIATGFNDIAIAQYYSGDYNNALLNNKAALAIRETLPNNTGLLISSLNKIALIYQETGNYDTASIYQFKILKLAEAIKDEGFIGITYNNIAFIYDNLKLYDKADFYAKKGLSIALKKNNPIEIARGYGYLANSFSAKEKYDSAIIYHKKALTLFKQEGDMGSVAAMYNNLGLIYRKNNNIQAGLTAYLNAYNIATQTGNQNDVAYFAANIGNVYIELKEYDNVLKYFTQAKQIATVIKNKDILRPTYIGLSNYYFIKNNIDSGIHYQSLYQNIVDTIYSITTTKQIAELQTQYETEKKEQQISLLNKENIIQKLTINKGRIFIGIGIFLLLSAVAFGFLYYSKNKIKQAATLQNEVMKQQAIATEAIIQAEENERSRIARDLHDGVGQMMSAAKMNLSLLEDHINLNENEKVAYEKAVALVDESCKEVRTVSHNMMPNALIKTGLASAIRAFIEQIETPALKVQLYTEGLNEVLYKNTEIVLYRVLQECVNNVIKHAAASTLDIALIKDDAGINATIEDNGKGFDTNNKNNFTGIGIENMQKRISFLKGTIEWQSSPGKGTLVAIYVPAA